MLLLLENASCMVEFFRRMDQRVSGKDGDRNLIDTLNKVDDTLDLFWRAPIDTRMWEAGKEMT